MSLPAAGQPVAACPLHPASQPALVCTRCGGFTCGTCVDAEGLCAACVRRAVAELPRSEGRASWATRFLTVSAASAVLGLMAALLSGQEEAYAAALILSGLAGLVGFVGSGICFLRWLHLAVRLANAHGIDVGATPGWAVGYWFIPFANLYRPYRVVKALAEGLGGPELAAAARVGPWWACWVIGNLVSQAEARVHDPEVEILVGVVSSLLGLGAALLAIGMVRALDAALVARRATP